MKKIYSFLFLFLSIVSLFVVIQLQEKKEYQQLEQAWIHPSFCIHFSAMSEEKEKLTLATLSKLAKEHTFNIYKLTKIDDRQTILYAKITTGSNQKRNELKLTKDNKNDANVLFKKNQLEFKELNQVLNDRNFQGSYLFQLDHSSNYSMEGLMNDFSELAGFSPEYQLREIQHEPTNAMNFYQFILGCVFLLLGLILLLDIYKRYRENQIKQLFGYTKINILQDKFKELLFFIILLLVYDGFFYSMYTFLLKETWHLTLLLQTAGFQIICISLIYSILTGLALMTRTKVTSVKGSNPFSKIIRVSIVLELVLISCIATLILFTFSNAMNTIKNYFQQEKIAAALANYNEIPLKKAPPMENETEMGTFIQRETALAHHYYTKGFIFARPTDNTFSRILDTQDVAQGFDDNEFWISPDYLDQCELLDLAGKKITVSANESDLIEIVPNTLAAKEKEISDYVFEDHQFNDFQVFRELFTDNLEKKPVNFPKPKIIYAQNTNNILRLSPEMENVKNPILRVITPSNTSPENVYFDSIFGRTNYFFVKGHKKELAQQINSYQLADYYPYVYTATAEMNRRWKDTMAESAIYLLIELFLIILWFTVDAFFFTSYLLVKKRTLLLEKYFGYTTLYSFSAINKLPLAIMGIGASFAYLKFGYNELICFIVLGSFFLLSRYTKFKKMLRKELD